MKYIKIKYLKEIELSDLDLDSSDAIFGHNPDGHDYDTMITHRLQNCNWARESQEIEIDLVIDTLTKLKTAGSNYVEIMEHKDHHGYVFTGLHMEKATAKEEEEYNQKEKKASESRTKFKIERLEKEITKLKIEELKRK